jgi:protein phosphatase 1 regulatory subunit 7
LELYDNKIVKIEGLEALVNLMYLFCGDCSVLDISFNNIKRIENIAHLTQLRKLFLLSNKIQIIENLQFPHLTLLELGANKISKVENLD